MNFGKNALTPAISNRDFIIPLILVISGISFLAILPFSAVSPLLILLLGVMSGIFIISIFALEDFNFLLPLYLIGFGIRVFLSFLFHIFSFVVPGNRSPGFLFLNDGWAYSQQGWRIFKFAERGIVVTKETYMIDPNMGKWSGNITSYDFIISHIYSITGYSPLSLFFIGSLTGSIAALFVYLIAKELFSKEVARTSALLIFFWPSFIMWSTQNLKEPITSMLICVLLWALFYMGKHPSPIFLFVAGLCAWALVKISVPFVVIVIAVISLGVLFLITQRLFKNKFAIIGVTLLVLISIYLFFKNDIMSLLFRNLEEYSIANFESLVEWVDSRRSVRAYGNLAFLEDFDISSMGLLLRFIPLGLLFTLFAPFPWQLGSINQIIAVPETIIFYILFPFTVRGVIFACRKRFNKSILLISIILLMLVFMTLWDANAGTLFRHRSVPFHLLLIFTAVGISLRKKSLRKSVSSMEL